MQAFVDWRGLQYQLPNMRKCVAQIDSLLSEVQSVTRGISANAILTVQVEAQVYKASEQIKNCRDSLLQTQNAAEEIAAEYCSCEQSLARTQITESGTLEYNWKTGASFAGFLGFAEEVADSMIEANKVSYHIKSNYETSSDSILDSIPLKNKQKYSKAIVDLHSQNESQDFQFRALGYELSDKSVEAYGIKLTGSEEAAFGSIVVGTTVGVTGLAIRGTSNGSWSLFGNSTQSDTKNGGNVTVKPNSANLDDIAIFDEYDGVSKKKGKFSAVDVDVSAAVGVTAAVLDYNAVIGSDDVSGIVDANIKLLDADIGASLGASYGEDGLAFLGKAEVGVSLAEVEGAMSLNIKGVEAQAKVSAEIGFGASFEVGYKNGEFSFELGAAWGVGGKVSFKVKLPKLW